MPIGLPQARDSLVDKRISLIEQNVAALMARQMGSVVRVVPDERQTTSADFVLAGDGVGFTPASSTRAVLTLSGALGNLTNGAESEMQLAFGQGDLPPQDTLLTDTNGQLLGAPINMVAARPADTDPVSLTVQPSLVIGQPYWLGIVFRALSGTATLSAVTLVAYELMDPLAPPAAQAAARRAVLWEGRPVTHIGG